MKRGLDLTPDQRTRLLDLYRGSPDPEVRFRSHILPLLGDGHTRATVATLPFRSSRTIDRWVKRSHAEGVEAVAGHRPGRRPRLDPSRIKLAVGWVTSKAPRDFGSLRSRWCCEAVAILIGRLHRAQVGREAVRRRLRRADLVYRRPRPVLGPKDPERQQRLDFLRELLASLPDDETAAFQDEVDINTNPRIGSMWMVKGEQAKVETPGTNEKRYLSGSTHWRTGRVHITEGKPKQGRNTAPFLEHLEDLRSQLGGYRKVHVICGRARCHTGEAVAIYLWGHREGIDLHLLPACSPDCDPIERVWWHLHEAVTRNHQRKSMRELLDLTFAWLGERNPLKVEVLSVYQSAA
jgi:transposase